MSQSRNLTLQKYFDGSFNILQEEVALFIKGFPIINMDQISSLNTLVGLLIKQNSMLGTRLRDQVVQIKDNFKRSEASISDMRRKFQEKSLELEGQLKDKQKEYQVLGNRSKEIERSNLDYAKQVMKLKEQLELKSKHDPQQMQRIEENLICLKNKLYNFVGQIVQTKFTKSAEIVQFNLYEINQVLNNTYQLISGETKSHYNLFVKDSKSSLEGIMNRVQQKIKVEKLRSKSEKQKLSSYTSVIDNIRQSIREFSIKSKEIIRVLKLANHNVDTSQIFLEGFEGEIDSLLKKVESIRQAVQQPSGRKSIDVSHLNESKKQRQSFESMLLKTVQALESGSHKKDYSSKIKEVQEQLKKCLKQVSENCKHELSEFQKYFRSETAKLVQQLQAKQQMSQEFERSLIESRNNEQNSKRMINEVSNSNLQLNKIVVEKASKIVQLQQTIADIKVNVESLERKRVDIEKEKHYIQQNLEESILSVATPLKQQLLRMRAQNQDIQEKFLMQKQDLLMTINAQKKKTQQLMINLCESKDDKARLGEKMALQGEQTFELSRMLSVKDKQIGSLGQLIRELETKIRCQAIELRGKQFQLNQNDTKIRQLVIENHTNMSQLKQIRDELPVVIELKNNLALSQQKFLELSEQNLKLKMLLKETKVELLNSRRAIGDLSEMSHNYEHMKNVSCTSSGELEKIRTRMYELQSSEDRLKLTNERLEKRVDELERYQMESLTLQAENNRLLIQVRHMKSVLGRIEEIRSYI